MLVAYYAISSSYVLTVGALMSDDPPGMCGPKYYVWATSHVGIPPAAYYALLDHPCHFSGHATVVEVLARYGAEIRSGTDRSLVAAAFKGHLAVAEVLLRNGEGEG